MVAAQATLQDEISATCVDLIFRDPFFGHFLLGISREISTIGPTLWVRPGADDKIVLGINPEFWRDQLTTKEHRMGCVKHEVLHIVFHHLARRLESFRGVREFDNQRLFNIAADLVVNQYIDAGWLIDGAVLLATFPELELEPEQDVHYYYAQLKQLAEQGKAGGAPSSEAGRNLKRLLADDPGARGGHHGFWSELQERSDTANTILGDWVDRQILNATSRLDSTGGWGNLPGGLVDYLREFVATRKPRVDWRRSLRLFTASSQTTYASNTMQKPSRRYKSIALWPDGSPVYQMQDGVFDKDERGMYIPVWESRYPGLKIRHRTQLLVAIDTSGSMDAETDLPPIFNELEHLARQDTDILVVEIDTQIQRLYHYPFPERKLSVQGRGGTDFNELLRFANGAPLEQPVQYWTGGRWTEIRQMRLPVPVDGIVYFTDGYAATPTEPVHKPLLWVIGGAYALPESDPDYAALPGQKVRMTNQAAP